MRKNKLQTLVIIFIAALLVSVLFNIRTFVKLYEVLDLELGEKNEKIFNGRLIFSWFNLIIEFVVFYIVALFNYSWLERIFNLIKWNKLQIPLIVVSNILLYFILIPAGKIFHNFYFASWQQEWNKEIQFDIQNFLIINISVFLLAILVATLLKAMWKMKIAEQENIRLVQEKSKAELSALKEQISPHFFFNTLSSLSTIVRNDEKEDMIEFIGEMNKTYRYTMTSKQDLVTVKEEVDFLKSYIFLIQKRFGEKVIFKNDIEDKTLNAKIPPMALQLLIENAFQHNIVTKEAPLMIQLYNDKKMICVENNINPKETTESFGTGLNNLGNRYRLLAKKEIVIEQDDNYFRVKIPVL